MQWAAGAQHTGACKLVLRRLALSLPHNSDAFEMVDEFLRGGAFMAEVDSGVLVLPFLCRDGEGNCSKAHRCTESILAQSRSGPRLPVPLRYLEQAYTHLTPVSRSWLVEQGQRKWKWKKWKSNFANLNRNRIHQHRL
jgi:hypothetical protein